eukprot:scaffold197423_cov20-Prasinocladus_malaysianus.AAC.1
MITDNINRNPLRNGTTASDCFTTAVYFVFLLAPAASKAAFMKSSECYLPIYTTAVPLSLSCCWALLD